MANQHPRLIPFQEAALIGYEEAERLGLDDLVTSIHTWGDDRLEWFRQSFLIDDTLNLYGRKLPSRTINRIPYDAIRQLISDRTRNALTTGLRTPLSNMTTWLSPVPVFIDI
jgi:hypothetical protein